MPLSAILANVLDFILSFSMLLLMMVYYRVVPTANVVWLPLLLLLALVASLGVSLVLSAMNVQFRDVRHALPFLVQIWMYATPVVYPASLITDPVWKAVYCAQPDGRRRRGISMGIARHGDSPRSVGLGVGGSRAHTADRRRLLLQTHGAHVRRCHLNSKPGR